MRQPGYRSPAEAGGAAVDAEADLAPRELQRRYPLVSALLDEMELMGDAAPAARPAHPRG